MEQKYYASSVACPLALRLAICTGGIRKVLRVSLDEERLFIKEVYLWALQVQQHKFRGSRGMDHRQASYPTPHFQRWRELGPYSSQLPPPG